MRRLMWCAALGLLASPVLADPAVRPVKTVRHIQYNMRTGEWKMVNPDRQREDVSIWASTHTSGYFFPFNWGFGVETIGLDWGDIASGSLVTQFQFAYATDGLDLTGEDVDIVFFNDENGFDNTFGTRVPIIGFRFLGLPNASGFNLPNGYGIGWIVTTISPKDPNNPNAAIPPFTLDGNDIDPDPPQTCGAENSGPRCWPDCPTNGRWYCVCGFGIGLSDFGYSEHYRTWFPGHPGVGAGSLLSGVDPNAVCTAFGIRAAFDAFAEDVNNPFDPNVVSLPEDGIYAGSFYFGPPPWGPPPPLNPFAQWHLELFTNISGCPCSADLNGDCVVDLADLAILLAGFGVTFDLEDLAILLSQWGCTG